MEVINKIQELFPRISSISMNDHDSVYIQVGHIGDIFDFRKMEKLSLSLTECRSGPQVGQGNNFIIICCRQEMILISSFTKNK